MSPEFLTYEVFLSILFLLHTMNRRLPFEIEPIQARVAIAHSFKRNAPTNIGNISAIICFHKRPELYKLNKFCFRF